MQKKILAIHDLSCCGRSSLVPVIASLAAAGHQCIPLPTAVFSTHTAIPGWVETDLTEAIPDTMEQYDRLGLTFEAIYAGFLGSARQAALVREASERLKAPGGLTVIDPVMGDKGKLYSTYTREMCVRIRELCKAADIITPNTTEAAILLGKDPASCPKDGREAEQWLLWLHQFSGAAIVLTGLDFMPGYIGTGCYTEGQCTILQQPRTGGDFPGTGDLFAAVMLGTLLNGAGLLKSCETAGAFVKDCIAYTVRQKADPVYGVQFEPLLWKLCGNCLNG